MSAASDFIERIEKEIGQRVDDDLADSNGLFTLDRVLGKERAREMLASQNYLTKKGKRAAKKLK